MERTLMLILSVCMMESGYAQSPETQNVTGVKTEVNPGGTGNFGRDSIISLPSYLSFPVKSQGRKAISNDFSIDLSDKTTSSVDIKFDCGYTKVGFYTYSKENIYLNLMDSRNATAGFYIRYYDLRFDALLTANKYLTANGYASIATTNQLGISGIMQYDFTPNWSVTAWGAYYNVNPYFSMAALPFIQTNSYGGFLQYKGDKAGIKLGAQSYYDAFRRQWRTEPIVTPSINISKKVKLEFPVGPLIQKSLERTILQSRNPVIISPPRP